MHRRRVSVRSWADYWRGRMRLRYGFCPRCNSSPPRESCPICRGEHVYGAQIAEANRRWWRRSWDRSHGRVGIDW